MCARLLGGADHRHHHAERADVERARDEVIFAARHAHHRHDVEPAAERELRLQRLEAEARVLHVVEHESAPALRQICGMPGEKNSNTIAPKRACRPRARPSRDCRAGRRSSERCGRLQRRDSTAHNRRQATRHATDLLLPTLARNRARRRPAGRAAAPAHHRRRGRASGTCSRPASRSRSRSRRASRIR